MIGDLIKGYAIALAVGGAVVVAYCALIVKGMLETARHPHEEDNP